ncbi:hypothetical protein MTYM_01934 [Methylococcales bacterium]|nr:hypothetical protein MTYM_01934 [Methylococcales bacterium]
MRFRLVYSAVGRPQGRGKVERLFGTYHLRSHRETGMPPHAAWLANGWQPRMPDSLEDLDLLLVMVAKSRVVQRDGIHFQQQQSRSGPKLRTYLEDT